MARMTRHEYYREAVRPQKHNPSKMEMAKVVACEIRRRLRAAGVLPQPTSEGKYKWHWLDRSSDTNGTVSANTRSEARAAIKRILGIRSDGRLPATVEIVKAEEPCASILPQ